MHTHADLERVRAMHHEGASISAIARALCVSRSTVRSWLDHEPAWTRSPDRGGRCPECFVRARARQQPGHYAFLLGLYLGDGHVSDGARTQRLRITLDKRYPLVIADARASVHAISGRRASVVLRDGCVDVSGYSTHWRCVFPQAGAGAKHLRRIKLDRWQHALVRQAPSHLVRGLLLSDGSRVVQHVGGRPYPRYFFSNRSHDIHVILRDALDQLDVRYTASRHDTTSVARRDAVCALDSFVGEKR